MNVCFDLQPALALLGAAGLDVDQVAQLMVGVDILGVEAYSGGAAAFAKIQAQLTCLS